MILHFETQALAESHLTASGFLQIKPHSWVSRDRTCRASTHPACGGTKVAIAYVEIERAA